MQNLSIDELEKRYHKAVSNYRYHHNTDSLSTWESEREERHAADKELDALSTEYKRRGLTPPYIP